MPYTQAGLDALRDAMATGALVVRAADGSSVTYRSLAEMQQAEAAMVSALNAAVGTPTVSRIRMRTDRGLGFGSQRGFTL